MDSSVQSPNENIRKIEDIIDIQKANGNYSVRQVAFSLPTTSSEAEGMEGAARAGCTCACAAAAGAGLARSLDSGLSEGKSDPRARATKKKAKRAKRHASPGPLPDGVSWPSDSDITVLRMKLCLHAGAELKEAVGDAAPGDGLHRPDSASMVNLATLMLQSEPPSKHSLGRGAGAEEYLLPLTSWERRGRDEPPPPPPPPEGLLCGLHVHDATCDNLSSKDSGIFSRLSNKSKVAKFLRLYFCPCCTCLYEMEKIRDEPSVYLTKCNTAENVQI